MLYDVELDATIRELQKIFNFLNYTFFKLNMHIHNIFYIY